MIESDVLYAFVKEEDWLKKDAERLLRRIEGGDFGAVLTSREVLHELYYVSMGEGVPLEAFISRAAAITGIKNLVLANTTYEIDLLALTLMKQYNLKSIFDSYYAATALNQVPDHTIASTDDVFDQIPGLKRVDPRRI